jgi:hypothetical protein
MFRVGRRFRMDISAEWSLPREEELSICFAK